jgi:hypothetical protein
MHTNNFTQYVENDDYNGLLDAVAKKLRQLNTEATDSNTPILIRLLSEFGIFLLTLEEHPFHEEHYRNEVFTIAQRLDSLFIEGKDPLKVFYRIMAKISNYAFKVKFAQKRGFDRLDDINVYIDES